MIEVTLIVHHDTVYHPHDNLRLRHIIDAEEAPEAFSRVTTLCGLTRVVAYRQTVQCGLCQKCAEKRRTLETATS